MFTLLSLQDNRKGVIINAKQRTEKRKKLLEKDLLFFLIITKRLPQGRFK